MYGYIAVQQFNLFDSRLDGPNYRVMYDRVVEPDGIVYKVRDSNEWFAIDMSFATLCWDFVQELHLKEITIHKVEIIGDLEMSENNPNFAQMYRGHTKNFKELEESGIVIGSFVRCKEFRIAQSDIAWRLFDTVYKWYDQVHDDGLTPDVPRNVVVPYLLALMFSVEGFVKTAFMIKDIPDDLNDILKDVIDYRSDHTKEETEIYLTRLFTSRF